ncbi:hypothetical protein MHC_02065 [Mycoplasma haemocanis str. Illinois]|uniref:Uncharacterized protein n=1 Tax=Mycoplasma haemocanis (strain Illinois) TaxID=1111676 RepID=H6N6K7_MYCHN|nr:hypothetical protein MHC_02065 [Mycoplasma haemocanis str. Illinois]
MVFSKYLVSGTGALGVAGLGGTSLQNLCKSNSSKLMYEYLGETLGYEKYHSWCTKE